jgi:hypothetical protein
MSSPDQYLLGTRLLLGFLTAAICLTTVLAVIFLRSGRGNPAWVGLPRGVGIVALLIGTFGYALGADVRHYQGWSAAISKAAVTLFVWGAVLCAVGHVSTWILQWFAERRS